MAVFLVGRIKEHGHRIATLRMTAPTIAFVHRATRMDDRCARPEVKRTLRSAMRRAGRSQKQAEALTEETFAVVQSNAGRLRTATMPAHYTCNEAANKGAVAQFNAFSRRTA